MLAAGDRIAERFVVEADVARGGTSVVYRAHDEATGRTVAVKLVAADARDARLRFAREAELLAELTHPGFARYVAHGQRGEHALYLAMEWIAGPTLRQRTKDAPLTIKGGVVEGAAYSGAAAESIADLPDRNTVNTQIVSAISGPARSLASLVSAVAGGLARCIQAKVDAQSGGAGAPAS